MKNEMTLKKLPTSELFESPMNPRKSYDQAGLDELARSIKENGVMTPIIVRPVRWNPDTDELTYVPKGVDVTGKLAECLEKYEIGAGHRRYRAADFAGLEEVPVVIRELDDDKFLELLIIENDQREDVHPMEEAYGFAALNARPSYDVQKIAERTGRSVKHIYDRIKLVNMSKNAQKLFLEGRFQIGHAVILARLNKKDQDWILNFDSKALFEQSGYYGSLDEENEKDPFRCWKVRTVQEFQGWVDDHIRFDREKVDQVLFPETIQKMEEAEKVVPITHEWYVQPSARSKEKTIGPRSWERADGKNGSKTCDHSVTGVVVVGPERGEAFKVCTEKEKCKIHWKQWQKDRAQRKKAGGNSAQKEREKKAEERRLAAEKKEKELQQRFEKALPEIFKVIGQEVNKKKYSANGYLAKRLRADVNNSLRHSIDKNKKVLLPVGKTADDLVKRYVHAMLCNELCWLYRINDTVKKFKKDLGIDLLKVLDEVCPPQKEQGKQTKAAKKRK